MVRFLTSWSELTRQSFKASDGVITSGVNGTFVSKNGDTLDLPVAGARGVYQIISESYRDGTAGKWAPDVAASGNNILSVAYGKYRAVTDQFAGTPAVGDKLKVNAAGKLAVTTTAGEEVAVCTTASHSITQLGKSVTVIEYVTL
jgi:hypothetical protein